MRWSLKLGRIAGIKILMHWTFLLLLGWVFFVYYHAGHSLGAALYGVGFVLALFACVIMHEFGHILTARHYGINTQDITLLPIGGVARLERIPREPNQELWVALAGPAVNVVIAAVLYLVLWVAGERPFSASGPLNDWFLGQLLLANVIIVVFNLLPAFPMDGGRVLRALLAKRLEYARATAIAARIGQMMAIVFGFLGFFINPLLPFLALFVYLGAGAEAQNVQITTTMNGITVQEAMITNFKALSAQDSLSVAVSELLAGTQQDFPVVRGEDVVGVLGCNDLVKALAEGGPDTPVGEAMRSDPQVIAENEKLETCYERLRENGIASLPVVRQGRLIGMVTLENITEWLMVHAAMNQPRTSAAQA